MDYFQLFLQDFKLDKSEIPYINNPHRIIDSKINLDQLTNDWFSEVAFIYGSNWEGNRFKCNINNFESSFNNYLKNINSNESLNLNKLPFHLEIGNIVAIHIFSSETLSSDLFLDIVYEI